jgi:hypothetical protein
MEANPNGRFVLVNAPQALPGACFICNGAKGPFIDTGISHQWHGAYYLCVTCITEIARTAGVQQDVNQVEVVRAYELGVTNTLNKTKAALDGLFSILFTDVAASIAAGSAALDDADNPAGIDGAPVGDESGVSEDSDRIPEDGGGPEDDRTSTDEVVVEGSKPAVDEGPTSVSGSGSDGESERIFL